MSGFTGEFTARNGIASEPLSSLTTMRIGGPATVVTIEDRASLPELLAQRVRWLGRGANLLVGDAPLAHPVARLGKAFAAIEIQPRRAGRTSVAAGAAADLAELIKATVTGGLAGPEGLAGVPATVGGALRMNAGTSTCWMLDWVAAVEALLPGEESPRWIERGHIPASYRDSGLPAGTVFLGCRLELGSDDPARLRETASRLKRAKAATQPLALASAGCVFKNPSPEIPAGRLIDELGFKGERVGGAMVSTVHANFIVNPERAASAADVCALIRAIRERAWRERGLVLSMEVESWNCPEELHTHPRDLVGSAP